MPSIEKTSPRESHPAPVDETRCLKPILANAWGRSLVAGIFVGLIPIVAVMWFFIDKQFMEQFTQQDWEQWVFLRSLSLLGDALPWIYLSLLIVLLGWFGKRRDIASWGAFLFCSIVVSGVVANLLKFIFMRARPNWEGVIPEGGSFSFPSGHAATIGAVATVFLLRWPRSSPVAAGIVALVALNRIFSQNHHITDVIAGIAMGLASALVVQWGMWKYHPRAYFNLG